MYDMELRVLFEIQINVMRMPRNDFV